MKLLRSREFTEKADVVIKLVDAGFYYILKNRGGRNKIFATQNDVVHYLNSNKKVVIFDNKSILPVKNFV